MLRPSSDVHRDSFYISGGSSANALVSAPPLDFCPLPTSYRAQLDQQWTSVDGPLYTSCLETSPLVRGTTDWPARLRGAVSVTASAGSQALIEMTSADFRVPSSGAPGASFPRGSEWRVASYPPALAGVDMCSDRRPTYIVILFISRGAAALMRWFLHLH